MNNRMKPTMPLLVLALLGLAIATDASANSNREKTRTTRQVQACVAEISKHADYGDASRVVHWAALAQRNLLEMEIRIETSVYLGVGDSVSRKYSSSCVTGNMGDLVKFRIQKD